ncbi:MAG: biopolymer transporter ExbD [Puniceicoccales bacterium]|jgi:biopolymer transport protein ExbD|nr:biopolymer transporter ExbD [Puniceicoccales bacterium]
MFPLHSPLGLRERLPVPETRVDTLPMITVLLIAILLPLAGSAFIYAPGLTVALTDEVEGDAGAAVTALPSSLQLPRSTQGQQTGVRTQATLTVPMLTAKSDTRVIFNGRFYVSSDPALQRALADAAQRAVAANQTPVLLLKADQSLMLGSYNALCDYAVEAGFKYVQIAREDRPAK